MSHPKKVTLLDRILGRKKEDSFAVILAEYAKMGQKNCNQCYGRGYIGANAITGQLVPCRKCIRKYQKAKKKNA